jgi:hypothetical protein
LNRKDTSLNRGGTLSERERKKERKKKNTEENGATSLSRERERLHREVDRYRLMPFSHREQIHMREREREL